MKKSRKEKKAKDKQGEKEPKKEGWSGMGGSIQGTLGGPGQGIAGDELHQEGWHGEEEIKNTEQDKITDSKTGNPGNENKDDNA